MEAPSSSRLALPVSDELEELQEELRRTITGEPRLTITSEKRSSTI